MLTAVYYDTDDLRLLKAGVTLRRREGGADEGWHLKLPDGGEGGAGRSAGASSRREIRLTLDQGDRDRRVDDGGDPVPEELARLVRAHARGGSLRPVARIETRRRLTILRDAAGTSLAEIAEDEVAAQSLGSSTTVSRWNEIEVEMTGGGPRLLRAAAARFRGSGLRPAGGSAKLERALAVDAWSSLPGRGSGPADADRRLTRRSQAGDVVLAYVNAQTVRLKALDPAVRRGEPDAVHQMRVTTRRLRAALQAFPKVVPGTAHLLDELRWLGQVLGDARDAEVLERVLPRRAGQHAGGAGHRPGAGTGDGALRPGPGGGSERGARGAGLAALLRDTRRSRPPARGAAADGSGQGRHPKRSCRGPLRIPTGGSSTGWAGHSGRRKAPRATSRSHEARKAAKRARYAAEAAEPAFGKKAKRFAKRMKAVQSVLGDHQDAVTARGWPAKSACTLTWPGRTRSASAC